MENERKESKYHETKEGKMARKGLYYNINQRKKKKTVKKTKITRMKRMKRIKSLMKMNPSTRMIL